MKTLLLGCFIFLMATTCQTKEKSISENQKIEVSQVILDYYQKQNKGYYDAMVANFAPEVHQFIKMSRTSPKAIVAYLKKQAKPLQYTPHLIKMKAVDNTIQLPVRVKKDDVSQSLLVTFAFDKNHKIITYQEELKNTFAAKFTKAKSYVGNYTYKKQGQSSGLSIQWQKGNEIGYSFTIANGQCLGEFSGKAFFISSNKAVDSNSNDGCSLQFIFGTQGQVKIVEKATCRQNRIGCDFSGNYKKQLAQRPL